MNLLCVRDRRDTIRALERAERHPELDSAALQLPERRAASAGARAAATDQARGAQDRAAALRGGESACGCAE